MPEQAFATGFLKCSHDALVLIHGLVGCAATSAIDHYTGRLIGNSTVCAVTTGDCRMGVELGQSWDLRGKDHVTCNSASKVSFTGWLRNIFLRGKHTKCSASVPIKF